MPLFASKALVKRVRGLPAELDQARVGRPCPRRGTAWTGGPSVVVVAAAVVVAAVAVVAAVVVVVVVLERSTRLEQTPKERAAFHSTRPAGRAG